MAQTSILVVEDDAAVRRGVADAFSASGYVVHEAADGPRGLEKALSSGPDLVLLDVMLPELGGIEVLAQLRRARPGLPVILLTARGAEEDRVRGLRTGADDYVVKPFSVIELMARVEAVLRRSAERPKQRANQVTIAGRTLQIEQRIVLVPQENGETASVELTQRECDVLAYFIDNPGRVIDREELLRYVWKIDPKGLETRTVDMLIARLREHVGDDPASPEVIATVRGKGYRLATQPDA